MNKKIEVIGRYSHLNNKWDISMSSIWNELLEHIHLVESYKSDLIVDAKFVEKLIETATPENFEFVKDNKTTTHKKITKWFGYRANGVDHFDFIMCKVFGSTSPTQSEFSRERYIRAEGEYRKLFSLVMEIDGDIMKCTLEKKSLYDFFKEYKGNIVG